MQGAAPLPSSRGNPSSGAPQTPFGVINHAPVCLLEPSGTPWKSRIVRDRAALARLLPPEPRQGDDPRSPPRRGSPPFPGQLCQVIACAAVAPTAPAAPARRRTARRGGVLPGPVAGGAGRPRRLNPGPFRPSGPARYLARRLGSRNFSSAARRRTPPSGAAILARRPARPRPGAAAPVAGQAHRPAVFREFSRDDCPNNGQIYLPVTTITPFRPLRGIGEV